MNESNLENGIIRETVNGMKRVKLPIPEEYGGGWATGSSVKDAVDNLIKRIKEKINQPKANTITFSECAEKWFELKSSSNKAATTIENYRMFLCSRIIPFFGCNVGIDKVKPSDIQEFFIAYKNMSKSFNHQCKTILKGIFEYAYRNSYIDKNPMQFTYETSKKTGKKVILQDNDLIDVIRQLDYAYDYGELKAMDYLYGCFLCFTSLRRGEILALNWWDFDVDKKEINICKNLTFPNGQNKGKLTTPKDDSYRTVYLSQGLYERILKCYGLPKTHLYSPVFYGDEALTDCMRPYLTRSQFMCMWKRINKVIDLKGATSHSFRSSYASMMNAHCPSADPKVIQSQLGHKTPDLAMEVYVKNNQTKTRQAEKELDAYLCKWLGTSI